MVTRGFLLPETIGQRPPETSGFSICDTVSCLAVLSLYLGVLYEIFGILPPEKTGRVFSKIRSALQSRINVTNNHIVALSTGRSTLRLDFK